MMWTRSPATWPLDKTIAIMEDSAAAEPPNALAPPPDALVSSSHVLVPPLVGAAKAAASTAGDAAPVATKAAIDTAGDAASAAAKAAADTAGDAAPAAESPTPLLDACVPPPGALVSSSHALVPPRQRDDPTFSQLCLHALKTFHCRLRRKRACHPVTGG